MKVCVLGLWHLGTVTAASLASGGHEVMGLDFDQQVITNLNNCNLERYCIVQCKICRSPVDKVGSKQGFAHNN